MFTHTHTHARTPPPFPRLVCQGVPDLFIFFFQLGVPLRMSQCNRFFCLPSVFFSCLPFGPFFYSLSRALYLSLTLSLSLRVCVYLSLVLSLSLVLPHTLLLSHTPSFSRSFFPPPFSPSHPPSLTFSLSFSCPFSISRSLSHTHTRSLVLAPIPPLLLHPPRTLSLQGYSARGSRLGNITFPQGYHRNQISAPTSRVINIHCIYTNVYTYSDKCTYTNAIE